MRGECEQCHSRMARDQRYCVECGTRRGPLAPFMAEWLGLSPGNRSALGSDRDRVLAAGGTGAARNSSAPAGAIFGRQMAVPSRPVVGVAVMALLAFGVLLGSSVSPVQGSSASAPLVVAVAHNTPAPGQASAAEAQASPPAAEAEPTPEASSPTSTTTAPAPAVAKHKSTKPKSSTEPTAGGPASPSLPPIKHVFEIVLSDQSFNTAFGPSAPAGDPSKTLTAQGELLEDYYAVAGGELANEIALVSGQGPTPQIAEDCPQYTAVVPGTVGALGQVMEAAACIPAPP